MQFPFDKILSWYEKNGRHHLPWRIYQTPYHVWISEIFLQQTQVSRVEKYFENVIKNFGDLKSFSQLEYEDFFPYYSGLGYYSRARNMLKTAKIVMEQYDGVFPRDYQSLVKLPGIGPYSANAILAFGYDESVLAFDTNIEKIFSRYYFGSRFIKLPQELKAQIQKDFEITGISGRDINAALMDFSSIIDLNNIGDIDFEKYFIKESLFYKQRGKNEIKPQKSKTMISKKDAQIIVFLHQNHKIYFSSNFDTYMPFSLGKYENDHREYIKNYFLKHFGLSLSVRPPFKKLEKSGDKYFLYHAQIQVGEESFGEFNRGEYSDYLKRNFL